MMKSKKKQGKLRNTPQLQSLSALNAYDPKEEIHQDLSDSKLSNRFPKIAQNMREKNIQKVHLGKSQKKQEFLKTLEKSPYFEDDSTQGRRVVNVQFRVKEISPGQNTYGTKKSHSTKNYMSGVNTFKPKTQVTSPKGMGMQRPLYKKESMDSQIKTDNLLNKVENINSQYQALQNKITNLLEQNIQYMNKSSSKEKLTLDDYKEQSQVLKNQYQQKQREDQMRRKVSQNVSVRRHLDKKIVSQIRKQYPSYLSSRGQPREISADQVKTYLMSSDKNRRKRTNQMKRRFNSERDGNLYPDNLEKTVQHINATQEDLGHQSSIANQSIDIKLGERQSQLSSKLSQDKKAELVDYKIRSQKKAQKKRLDYTIQAAELFKEPPGQFQMSPIVSKKRQHVSPYRRKESQGQKKQYLASLAQSHQQPNSNSLFISSALTPTKEVNETIIEEKFRNVVVKQEPKYKAKATYSSILRERNTQGQMQTKEQKVVYQPEKKETNNPFNNSVDMRVRHREAQPLSQTELPRTIDSHRSVEKIPPTSLADKVGQGLFEKTRRSLDYQKYLQELQEKKKKERLEREKKEQMGSIQMIRQKTLQYNDGFNQVQPKVYKNVNKEVPVPNKKTNFDPTAPYPLPKDYKK